MLELVATTVAGTIPSWILVAVALFVAWRVSRGGGGSAVSELSEANRVLDKRLHEERGARELLGGEVRDLREQNAELRGRTDFATSLAEALGPILAWTAGHERRAQDRHDAMLAATERHEKAVLGVLELVAARLGPEPNGGG